MNCRTSFLAVLSLLFLLATGVMAQDSSGVRGLYQSPPYLASINEMVVQGQYGYIAAGASGLGVMNLTNPASPELVRLIPTATTVRDVCVSGSRLYFSEDAVIRIFDITNPTNPIPISTIPMNTSEIEVEGNELYALSGARAVKYDVANPATPTMVSQFIFDQNYNYYMRVYRGFAYIHSVIVETYPGPPYGAYFFFFRVIDFRGSTTPIMVFNSSAVPYRERTELLFSNNNAFTLCNGSLYILNIANPVNTTLLGQVSITSASDLALVNGFACIANRNSGIAIVNVSDPTNPRLIGFQNASTYVSTLAASGSYLYAARSGGFLQSLQIETGPSLRLIGQFDRIGVSQTIVKRGNSLLSFFPLPSYSFRLASYRYEQATPVLQSSATDGLYGLSCGFGNTMAVVGGANWCSIIDITNPDSVRRVGSFPLSGNANTVALRDTTVYISIIDNAVVGIRIVSIANPESARVIRNYATSYRVNGLHLNGRRLYVAYNESGIDVLDCSRPDTLIRLANFATFTSALSVKAVGARLYVAEGRSGLEIIDIADLQHPIRLGRHETGGFVTDVDIASSYAFVADSVLGVRVLNVSNPSNMREVGYYNTLGKPVSIQTVNDTVYVAESFQYGFYDCSQALGVVDRIGNDVPQSFTLYQNYPNPFNSSTTITYTIPKTGEVSLRLYDVNGREVNTLVNFLQNPGTYTVKIDGSSLASGTYFVQLKCGNQIQTKKLVLLK